MAKAFDIQIWDKILKRKEFKEKKHIKYPTLKEELIHIF